MKLLSIFIVTCTLLMNNSKSQNNSKAYGPTNDNESIAALNQAIECGINFFDTSPLYGYGHSEKLIGETLHPYRDKIIIATKVGYTDFSGKQNFSSDYIRKSLEKTKQTRKEIYAFEAFLNILNTLMNLFLIVKPVVVVVK